MSFQRRVELFLFCIALLAFGWFNQGGGWNQNARFAEVRAIVDGGELKLDNYFVYERHGGKAMRRYPVVNGDVTIRTKTRRLSWVGEDGNLTPINGIEAPANMDEVALSDFACSGDVSFARGHFHPNKPPGLSFVAVPAYFVLSHFERFMHRNPDTWWLMNVNAWLAAVFSVGLISAAGVVLAFRIGLQLSDGQLWPAFWAAVAFGFGTIYFPYATLLFDHNVTAVLLIGAFYCLFARQGAGFHCLAGLLAGMASITNYIAAVPAGMLGLYLVWRQWSGGRPAAAAARGLGWYGLGLLGPFIAICAYNKACYGSPFALCNAFQNPAFIDKGPVFLGMFGIPNPGVALILLISPLRGIFYSAPIVAMGVYGLWRMRRAYRAEAALFSAIFVLYLLVNSSFNGWHAGYACGSRYMIPGIMFLTLPCVFGFMKLPRLSGALLAVSFGINFLFTVTDVESPVAVGDLAMPGNREMYLYSPLTDYSLPLFFQGRAWPILNELISDEIAANRERLTAQGMSPDAQRPILARLEAGMRQSVLAGSDDPFDLGSYCGPVSVNPTGVCEGGYYSLFDAGTPQARWNSFNVGEFWFPGSRWSVAPLLMLVGLFGAGLAWEWARSGAGRGAAFEEFAEAIPAEEVAAE